MNTWLTPVLRIFSFVFLFSLFSAKLFAFSHGLFYNIDAALQASGEDFFSTPNHFSSFDTSLAPDSKNFYFKTAGMFAQQYHNYEINTVSQLSAGNLFVGSGAVFHESQDYFLNIGLGKKFNRRIASGFLLRPFFRKTTDKKKYQGGISLNYSFRLQLAAQKRENIFALHSFEMIFAIHNLGVSWFFPHQKEDRLLLGVQTQIIKAKHFSLLLLGKVGWKFATEKILWSSGIQFSVYFMRLRSGYAFDALAQKQQFSFGLGGVHSWDNNIFTIDYGFSLDFFEKPISAKNMYHSLSFSFAWNTRDEKPPQVKLQAKNFVNANDTAWSLHNKLKEKSDLANWQLIINNEKKEQVAYLQMDGRKKLRYFTPLEYLKDFFSSKNRRHLPKEISWNFFHPPYSAQNYTPENAHTALDIPAQDGNYFYQFFAQDEHGNQSQVQRGKFIIDTTPVKFGSFKTAEVFYATPKKRFFKLKIPIHGQDDDVISVSVYNAQEKKIESWQFALSNYKGVILWDTKTAKEGMYKIVVQGKDLAQNISQTASENFYIVKEKNIAGGNTNASLLVPLQPPFVYTPQTFRTNQKIKRWSFTIFSVSPSNKNFKTKNKNKDKDKNKNKNKKQKIVYQKVGGKYLPTQLVWDGKIFSAKKADDGKYKMVFKIYEQENNFGTDMQDESVIKNEVMFTLDTTPPKIVLTANNNIIADDDLFKDFFRFKLKVKDASAIRFYRLRIFEKTKKFTPVLVKEFNSNQLQKTDVLPKQFVWNNQLPNGQKFLSFAKFGYDFFMEDQAGNTTTIKRHNLKSNVSGVYQNNAFRFSIPLPSSQLKGKQRQIKTEKLYAQLRRKLTQALQYVFRYPDYHIKIEAHVWPTQPATQLLLNQEERSLKNSEELAYKVLQFFLARGISSARVSFVGLGESEALYPNQHIGNYGNRQNQRIGIVLYKP